MDPVHQHLILLLGAVLRLHVDLQLLLLRLRARRYLHVLHFGLNLLHRPLLRLPGALHRRHSALLRLRIRGCGEQDACPGQQLERSQHQQLRKAEYKVQRADCGYK